jgi:hypothetical protein
MQEPARVDPDPRLVSLIDRALDEVLTRLYGDHLTRYAEWIAWARRWRAGEHSPAPCVAASHSAKDDGIGKALGQLAWGAKEACYSTPKSGWLVIWYVADTMMFWGVAFPEDGELLLPAPNIVDAA